MRTETLENTFTLRVGDTLSIDVQLNVEEIIVPIPVYKVLLSPISPSECKAELFAVQNEPNTTVFDGIVRGVRDEVNKQLVALAEKRGGFLSAKEMSDYLLKQDFIRELRRK